MPKSIEGLVSFSAGIWSPTLTSRVDQQKYRAACLQLENMICLKAGPADRRPGTQFIARTKTFPFPFNSSVVRLQDFTFSVNTKFILEWGLGYLRFYSNGRQVTVSSAPVWTTATNYPAGSFVTDPTDALIYYSYGGINGGTVEPHLDPSYWVQRNIYELPTPYDATPIDDDIKGTEVFQLQFCAINDVVYVCHPNHPRYKLTRILDDEWTFAPVVDTVPALLDQNATDTTIASSATTGTTTLTASAPTWTTTTYYGVGASVLHGGEIYECLVAHVSGTFATDLAADRWVNTSIFQAGHVGSYWELSNLRDAAYVEYTGTAAGGFAAGTSASITAFGRWEVRTYGLWSADVAIESSANGGVTWETVRLFTGRFDRNANVEGTASVALLYRIVVSNVAAPATAGATNPRIVFECVDAFLFGIVRITAVAGSYSATAEVVTQLPTSNAWISGNPYIAGNRVSYSGVNYVCILAVTGATTPPSDTTHWTADGFPTIYWSEGAWSAVRGYPRAITSFQQKIYCGFTEYQPQRIWGTQTGDIENWDLGDGSLATDGVAFDLDAVGDGAIVWMQAQDALFVGLVSAEWVIGSSDVTGTISPTSVSARRQSRWGSNVNIAARVVGDALIFAQRQAFTLRQMLFSIATNKYMSQDLTALAEQILDQGAIQDAHQQQWQRNGIIWATTIDGNLVGMTYELDQQIFGWHVQRTAPDAGDKFESVACIPGSGINDDEVWVVVKRVVGGTAVRYVERINPRNWRQSPVNAVPGAPGYPANKNEAYYVDSGVTYENWGSNVFTGLGHLEGREAIACIDAVDYGRFTVSGGQITVPDFEPPTVTTPPNFAHVGLPMRSVLQPMNLDVDVHTGASQGIVKKITGLTISFKDTLACKFAASAAAGATAREIIFRENSPDLNAQVQLFDGSKRLLDFPGDYGIEIPIVLSNDGPLPMMIRSIAVAYGLAGSP